jgi:hypothetical protein
MGYSMLQTEVSDQQAVDIERYREQEAINDRREAARLSGRRLGSVSYTLAAQVAFPDYGGEGEARAKSQLLPQITENQPRPLPAKTSATPSTKPASCKPKITKRKQPDSQGSDNGDSLTAWSEK